MPIELLAQFEKIYVRRTGNWGPPRRLGTYLVVRSKDGLINQGYSGRSNKEVIPGDGARQHQLYRLLTHKT